MIGALDTIFDANAQDVGEIAAHLFKDDTGVRPSSCSDVAKYCNADNLVGVRARQFCPVTCGCDSADSALVIAGSSSACPSSCRRTTKYNESIFNRSCEDLPATSYKWKEYAQHLNEYSATTSSWLVPYLQYISTVITHHNESCANITSGFSNPSIENLDLCWPPPRSQLRPLTSLCPVTCRCPDQYQDLCPLQCTTLGTRSEFFIGSSLHQLHPS